MDVDQAQLAAGSVSRQFMVGLEAEYGGVGWRWLVRLPRLLKSLCARWELKFIDPIPRHGYLSLVWPVRRGTENLALKATVPSPTFLREIAGLRAWAGHGMVQLHEYDTYLGSALLQWLDASLSRWGSLPAISDASDGPEHGEVATLGRREIGSGGR